MEIADFREALRQICKTPVVDDVVFRFFAGKPDDDRSSLATPKGRMEFLKKLEEQTPTGE